MSAKKNQLTKEYKAACLVVRQVMWEHDPIGIGLDAPEDEYDMEIAHILPLFNKGLSDEALALGVEQVFIDSFGGEKRNKPHDASLSLIRDIRIALKEAGLTGFLKINE